MSSQQWIPLKRDFANEGVRTGVPAMRPATDPLADLDLHLGASSSSTAGEGASSAGMEVADASSEPAAEASDSADPLGGDGGFVDPLSAFTDPLSGGGGGGGGADTFGAKPSEAAVEEDDYEEGFVSWGERREGGLTEYQTDKTITIANLKNIDNVDDAAVAMQASASMPASRERSRLDELENTEAEGQRQMLLMTCSEYTAHVRQLNALLTQAWQQQERVKAVKLAIQVRQPPPG